MILAETVAITEMFVLFRRATAGALVVLNRSASVVPLVTMALLDLRWLGRGWSTERRMRRHAACVAVFLVVAHVATIFGMLDPTLLGAAADPHAGHAMP